MSNTDTIADLGTVYDSIIYQIAAFCRIYLDTEYQHLADEAALVLCNVCPDELTHYSVELWAGSIIYTIGYVNYMFDPQEDDYIPASRILEFFKITRQAMYRTSQSIRDKLGIERLDPNWCVPGKLQQNVMVWMVEVDGIEVDIRNMPLEIQEIAFNKGLIPYVPGIKKDDMTTDVTGRNIRKKDEGQAEPKQLMLF